MTLTVEVPLEEGELVLAALDAVLAGAEEQVDAPTSYRARQADALIGLCRRALLDPAGDSEGAWPGACSDLYQVVVHTDASALAGSAGEGRADLPVETVRRLSCDGALVPVANDASGAPLSIGRKRRTVSTALKRALLARDRHCCFPGCSHTRFVDAHHVQHWAQGGRTDLDNLLLLYARITTGSCTRAAFRSSSTVTAAGPSAVRTAAPCPPAATGPRTWRTSSWTPPLKPLRILPRAPLRIPPLMPPQIPPRRDCRTTIGWTTGMWVAATRKPPRTGIPHQHRNVPLQGGAGGRAAGDEAPGLGCSLELRHAQMNAAASVVHGEHEVFEHVVTQRSQPQ
jgi:hypothetical protein